MMLDMITREVSGLDVATQVCATALAASTSTKQSSGGFLMTLAERPGFAAKIVEEIHD